MSPLLKIAARNLAKNRRRSLYALLAIALGFTAVNVFGGFTRYMNTSLRDGFIYSQGQGHLTVFKRGFLTRGTLDPVRYLLAPEEAAAIEARLHDVPGIALVTPQLHISGLLSNGDASTVFLAAGRVPSAMEAMAARATGMLRRLRLYEGRSLRDDTPTGIGVSTGLARALDLELGSGAVAVAPTVEGQVNALDAEVFQLFESPLDVLNDKLVLVPLAFAQDLYDTRSVDRLTVLLERTADTGAARDRLAAALAPAGIDTEIKTWEELSLLYTKVRRMFDLIFAFLFVIVLVISVMSVVNTINMAVMERIREIGTLRALGMRRGRIVTLFAVESGLLGVLGSLLGGVLTLLVWLAIAWKEPTWVPPLITKRVPLEVHLVPEYLAISFLFLLLLTIGAACFPARRAVRKSIVDALGHV